MKIETKSRSASPESPTSLRPDLTSTHAVQPDNPATSPMLAATGSVAPESSRMATRLRSAVAEAGRTDASTSTLATGDATAATSAPAQAPQIDLSRYEPQYRHSVSWHDSKADVTTAMQVHGFQEGVDYHVRRTDFHGFEMVNIDFREAAKARKVRPTVVRSPEYKECQQRLLDDAKAYFVLPAVADQLAKPRPVPTLAPDASPQTVLKTLLDHSGGVVVGEVHSAIASKRLLIDQMPTLVDSGVKTLFMEHLFSDRHQAALDSYLASPPNSPMPETLSAMLTDMNEGHMDEFSVGSSDRPAYKAQREAYNFTTVVEAAKRAGLKIVAIDCEVGYAIHLGGTQGTPETAKQRYETMNYLAAQRIADCRQQHGAEFGKWIALVGNAHSNTYKGVPGVSELTGALAICAQDKKSAPEDALVRTDVKNFQPGLNTDVLLTMPL